MDTQKVKLSQVTENVENPRTITDRNLQKLITSILVFPKMLALRPIVVDDTMTALGGNMRLRALSAISTFSPEQIANRLQGCTDYEKKTPAEREALINYWRAWLEEPTTEVANDKTLTEDEKRAFIIKDNVAYGEWDEDALTDGWDAQQLEEWNIDTWNADLEVEADEDGAEEDNYTEQDAEEAVTRVSKGDIWQLGAHRLMCGDSTKQEDVSMLMEGKQADLFLTDPPYNVSYKGKTADMLTIINDDLEDTAFRAFLTDAFRNAVQSIREGAAFYIWHADTEGLNFRLSAKDAGLCIKEVLVWVKNGIVLGRQDYQWKHEPCLYGWKEGAAHYFTNDRSQATTYEDSASVDYKKMKKEELLKLIETLTAPKEHTTILHEAKPNRNDIHPTMKPVKLMGRLVRNSTQKGWRVLDLFGGSGSTLIACEQLGRVCYMMELDTRYCDAIIDRWEKLTGQTAVLISNS